MALSKAKVAMTATGLDSEPVEEGNRLLDLRYMLQVASIILECCSVQCTCH